MLAIRPQWLFGAAAAFNLAIGSSLLLARRALTPLVGLDTINGTNLVTYYLTAAFVTLFGYAYVRAAFNPARYRPYIVLGLAGKLIASAAILTIASFVRIPPSLLALAGADLIFSFLMIAFLRQTAHPSDTSAGP
ncbi:MAG: hypothetical protein H2055_02095 [Sphingopyxis sp.]|nr:hypothetical protein [Sphingopyxis sp.]